MAVLTLTSARCCCNTVNSPAVGLISNYLKYNIQ